MTTVQIQHAAHKRRSFAKIGIFRGEVEEREEQVYNSLDNRHMLSTVIYLYYICLCK